MFARDDLLLALDEGLKSDDSVEGVMQNLLMELKHSKYKRSTVYASGKPKLSFYRYDREQGVVGSEEGRWSGWYDRGR